MAIYRLLQTSAFSPEAVNDIKAAYEQALQSLDLQRDDPETERLARKIIEFAQLGVREPAQICNLVLKDWQAGR